MNFFSERSNVIFSPNCFEVFSFFFFFFEFYYDISWSVFLEFVVWGLLSVLENSQPYSLQILLLPQSISFPVIEFPSWITCMLDFFSSSSKFSCDLFLLFSFSFSFRASDRIFSPDLFSSSQILSSVIFKLMLNHLWHCYFLSSHSIYFFFPFLLLPFISEIIHLVNQFPEYNWSYFKVYGISDICISMDLLFFVFPVCWVFGLLVHLYFWWLVGQYIWKLQRSSEAVAGGILLWKIFYWEGTYQL